MTLEDKVKRLDEWSNEYFKAHGCTPGPYDYFYACEAEIAVHDAQLLATHDEKVKTLLARIVELEQAIEISDEQEMAALKMAQNAQARIERARGTINKMLEPCSCGSSCLVCSTRKVDSRYLLAALEEKE